MSKRRIGILTGGGDVPGLNSVIKSVVYRGGETDCEVLGIWRAWTMMRSNLGRISSQPASSAESTE